MSIIIVTELWSEFKYQFQIIILHTVVHFPFIKVVTGWLTVSQNI